MWYSGWSVQWRRVFTILVLVVAGMTSPCVNASPVSQAASAIPIDVTISLYRSPITDVDRAPYERIIEYFADGVYESSNGAHKLREVSIYTGGAYSDKADIVWVAECHPAAPASGRSVEGWHITMCDHFSSMHFLADDRGWQWGGYTLAHEWGHYLYSLYDEYRGDGRYDNLLHFPHSTDDPVTPSVMNDQFHAMGGHFEWLNFSTAKNNTGNTAQHRAYGASGWETLARPISDDPRDGPRKALPVRIYYPELAAVAPRTDADPAIDLPGTARSDLKIIWVSERVTYQIVLDHSGSMGDEDKMTKAKLATKMLVDLAEIDRATIGIIMFDDQVTVVQPLTNIASQATKDAIKTKIDSIEPRNRTAIGDAIRKALDDLLTGDASGADRVVFLLTDGLSNSGSDPMSIVPDCKSARVPLYTFAYGSDADVGLLRHMAEETGGKSYYSPTTLTELIQAFQDASQVTSRSVGIQTGRITVRAATPSFLPIAVDGTVRRLEVVATYKGAPSSITLTLEDPSGNPWKKGTCSTAADESVCYFSVDTPLAGTWTLRSAASSDTTLTYRVNGATGNLIPYTASATSLTGSVVQYPEPIVVLAILSKEVPLSGAVVTATIEDPSGRVAAFPILDNGVAPDAVADDGLYSAMLDYSEDGVYNIIVQFDNSARTAHLTYASLQPSIGPGGTMIPLPTPVPILEDFQRFARLQITVTGVSSDDHGDTPQTATPLQPDNTEIPGRIDRSNDLDVFAIRSPHSGRLTVRVSGLALGMDPQLRILGHDGSTVRAQGTLITAATERGYVAIPVEVGANEMIYAEVSHRGAERGCRYQISAGASLVGEGKPAPSGDTGRTTRVERTNGGVMALLAFLILVAVGGLYTMSGYSIVSTAGVQVIQGRAARPRATLRRGQLLIGRAADCEMRLMDPTVSARHAVIRKTSRGYVIQDLNSLNHTFVNGQQVSERLLQPGDEIRVGNVRLKFGWAGQKKHTH